MTRKFIVCLTAVFVLSQCVVQAGYATEKSNNPSALTELSNSENTCLSKGTVNKAVMPPPARRPTFIDYIIKILEMIRGDDDVVIQDSNL